MNIKSNRQAKVLLFAANFYTKDYILIYILLTLCGFLGGVLGGLLGIGGGVIFILVLPVALLAQGVAPSEIVQFSIANSLFGTIFSAAAGIIRQHQLKNLYLKEMLLISFLSVLVSLLTLEFIVNTSFYSKARFDLVFVSVLMFMLIKSLPKKKDKETHTHENPIAISPNLAWIGTLSGLVSPLTGLGGGIIVVPMLVSFFKYTYKRANSISLGVVGITAIFSSLYNMFEKPMASHIQGSFGYLVFPVALPLALGVVFGSPLGVNLSQKLSHQTIQKLFFGFIFLVLLKKISEMILK